MRVEAINIMITCSLTLWMTTLRDSFQLFERRNTPPGVSNHEYFILIDTDILVYLESVRISRYIADQESRLEFIFESRKKTFSNIHKLYFGFFIINPPVWLSFPFTSLAHINSTLFHVLHTEKYATTNDDNDDEFSYFIYS